MRVGAKSSKIEGKFGKKQDSRIGNNDIYTHIPIHNKQTINVLRVIHPQAPVQFLSSFYVLILGNFVSVISLEDLPGRLF